MSEPSNEPILKHFTYAHLPAKLQEASAHFCALAQRVVEKLPRCAERTVALRKLLEAKDAAVRAANHTEEPASGPAPVAASSAAHLNGLREVVETHEAELDELRAEVRELRVQLEHRAAEKAAQVPHDVGRNERAEAPEAPACDAPPPPAPAAEAAAATATEATAP